MISRKLLSSLVGELRGDGSGERASINNEDSIKLQNTKYMHLQIISQNIQTILHLDQGEEPGFYVKAPL